MRNLKCNQVWFGSSNDVNNRLRTKNRQSQGPCCWVWTVLWPSYAILLVDQSPIPFALSNGKHDWICVSEPLNILWSTNFTCKMDMAFEVCQLSTFGWCNLRLRKELKRMLGWMSTRQAWGYLFPLQWLKKCQKQIKHFHYGLFLSTGRKHLERDLSVWTKITTSAPSVPASVSPSGGDETKYWRSTSARPWPLRIGKEWAMISVLSQIQSYHMLLYHLLSLNSCKDSALRLAVLEVLMWRLKYLRMLLLRFSKQSILCALHALQKTTPPIICWRATDSLLAAQVLEEWLNRSGETVGGFKTARTS